MIDEKRRLGKGLVVALAVHLAVAVGLGFFGYHFSQTPPEVIEVSLAGGGGGASEEVEQEEQQEESFMQSLEDIVDNKLKPKPEKKQVVKKKQSSNVASKASSNSAHSGKGTGNAVSSGSGSGSGGGNGSGSGSGNGDGVGEGHGVITQRARLTRDVKPKYPVSAVSSNFSGSATVRLVISADGIPESVSIIASSGNSAIDNSIVDAAYKWRFAPATDKYGERQRDTAKRTVKFSIVK